MWLRIVTKWLPITKATEAFRGILLKGSLTLSFHPSILISFVLRMEFWTYQCSTSVLSIDRLERGFSSRDTFNIQLSSFIVRTLIKLK